MDGPHTVRVRVLPGLEPGVIDEVVQLGQAQLPSQHDLAALGVEDPPTVPTAGAQPWREQVCEGLESLGWSSRDAETAADAVAGLAESEPMPSVSTLMKAALASLARA